MNRFTLIVLFSLVAAARAVAPPAAEDVLRARVKDFNQALLKENYNEAIHFIDPDILDIVGDDQEMKKKLSDVITAIKGANAAFGRKLTGVTVRRVTFDKDKTNATVNVAFSTASERGGGNRFEFPGEQTWTLKGKTWYWVK